MHNALSVPLTDQVRIDREEIYDILDQMRATIPGEIKQARWIVKERQEMLAEAKREDRMLGEAREQAVPGGFADRDREAGRAPGSGHHRRLAAPGSRDEARHGGLGRQHPLHGAEPRAVPMPSAVAASDSTSARRRPLSPASPRRSWRKTRSSSAQLFRARIQWKATSASPFPGSLSGSCMTSTRD